MGGLDGVALASRPPLASPVTTYLRLRNTIAVGGRGLREDTRLKQQVVAAAEPAARN